MSIGTLPQTLKVGGRDWRIRTDFRDILKIFEAMNDRELEHEEKIYTMLYILYPDLEKMPVRLYQEAAEQANWFIDAGTQDDEGENVRKMDWTQDEPIIFPAVNAVEVYALVDLPWIFYGDPGRSFCNSCPYPNEKAGGKNS